MKENIGQKFGRLTIVDQAPRRVRPSGNYGYYWNVVCDCGSAVEVQKGALYNGHPQSCGCYNRELITRHGRTSGQQNEGYKKDRTYKTWDSMRQRCNNENAPDYSSYGGRGIFICSQWDDFNIFLEDMGDRPQGCSIERIDVNGNYCPDNCRWATSNEQAQNKRSRREITIEGTTKSVMEWCKYFRLDKKAIHRAYARLSLGWEPNKAFTLQKQ